MSGLFDLAPFTDERRARAKRPKAATTPPHEIADTVEVVVSDTWRFVHPKSPGIVHAGTDKKRLGATVLFCGLIGTPLTFTQGETVHGCAACIQRGAPR